MTEWKAIPGYDDNYLVSDEGEVYSKYKDNNLSQHTNEDDGYVRVALKDNTYLVHRLVATVFLGNHNNMCVNHKDGNKQNNVLSNLEWVTQRENALHCAHEINEQGKQRPSLDELEALREQEYSYSKLAKKYNVSKTSIALWLGRKSKDTKKLKEFEILENEIVKPILGFPHYFASNFGRILSRKSGIALKPQIQPNGYTAVELKVNGKRYRRYIHRMVAMAFYGKSDLVVNHKNKNKEDNRLENLEYTTQSKNVKKSANRKLTRRDYIEIHKLKQSGLHRKEIANMYCICETYVNVICRKVNRGTI